LVIAGCPIKMTGTPTGIYARAPQLGEHTEQVLAEAGLPIARKEQQP
jgi:crotonobetainyl-CoA:carnitine CoA-transferase CaiB-like acyl-CoA transferase